MTVSRRTTLKGLMLAMAAASSPAISLAATKRKLPWKNWAGTHTCYPETRATPKSIDELIWLVRTSKNTIRAVGAAHSWSPLVPTDGTILSLRKFKGIIEHDAQQLTTKIGAGTKLNTLGEPLDQLGQGMFNLPDIDEQSLAGALATGTHGTGLNLKALHGYVEALTLVTGTGEVIECSAVKNTHVYQAAKVSLGSLGIVTDLTLRNRPAYNLKRKTWFADIDEMMDGQAQSYANKYRHFEFFYIPYSGQCYCQASSDTDNAITGRPADSENDAVHQLKDVRDLLGFSSTLRGLALKTLLRILDLPPTYIEKSWKTLTNDRTYPIVEMEYQLPLEAGPLAMREIIAYVESNHPEFFVPLEYRYVDSDDAWLSEYYGRKSVSISVHRFRDDGIDPWRVFKPVQDIFRKYEGRPHWGKVHTYTYDDLKSVYPKMDDFRKIRQELDPEGKFLNHHLKQMFNVV